MSRHLPAAGAIAVAVAIALAIAVFLVFNASFGGPSLVGSTPGYRLTADVGDAQNLIDKSLVLTRGVKVGEATGVKLAGGHVRLTLAIDPAKTAVYRDATIQVGHRTLFGEAYVRLDPGHPAAGPLPSGSTLPPRAVTSTVELDEALSALDRTTRRHLTSLAHTGALVEGDPRTADRLNRSLGGLSRLLVAFRRLSGELDGQEGNLRGFVANAATMSGQLAAGDRAISSLVSGGRVTLQAMTTDSGALRRGVAQAGRLVDTARLTLSDLRPLIPKATPVVDGLTAAAPTVSQAFRRLPPTSRALATTITRLPAFDAAALPALRAVRGLGRPATAAVDALEPALRDLVPVLRYVGPHGRGIVGFYAAGISAVQRLGADGTSVPMDINFTKHLKDVVHLCQDPEPCGWGRFAIGPAVGTALGERVGLAVNPYPASDDASSAWSGTYPRLEPEPSPSRAR